MRWSAETRRRLRAQRLLGLVAFFLIGSALILLRAPQLSLAGLVCAVRDSWVPAVVLAFFLSPLVVDLFAWARYALGVDRFPLDQRLRAGADGGGPATRTSRRVKWLGVYPFSLIMAFAFLRFAAAPTCA